MDRAKWLSAELYKMEVSSLNPSERSWLNFSCELEVVGEVLDTFEEDEDAARTIRDRLCGWARVWGRYHPDTGYRHWYRGVAEAAERGDWETVSWLCQKLIEIEQRREEQ
jgi:hypothetical protein